MACLHKIKIGHHAKFQNKHECFLQVVFLVDTILQRIPTSGIMRAQLLIAIFIQSGDKYTLAMTWVGYICMWLRTLSRLLNIILSTKYSTIIFSIVMPTTGYKYYRQLRRALWIQPLTIFLIFEQFFSKDTLWPGFFFIFLYFIITWYACLFTVNLVLSKTEEYLDRVLKILCIDDCVDSFHNFCWEKLHPVCCAKRWSWSGKFFLNFIFIDESHLPVMSFDNMWTLKFDIIVFIYYWFISSCTSYKKYKENTNTKRKWWGSPSRNYRTVQYSWTCSHPQGMVKWPLYTGCTEYTLMQ